MGVGGIFSPVQRSILRHANKALIPYCTSDAHMGDAEAFGMQFRGARVIQAVLTDLVKRRGLGSGPTKDIVIFGGQSAGARGGMIHLDYVLEMLGASAAENVDVFGFLDSPAWLDMKPYHPKAFVGFAAESQSVFSYANVKHLGAECMDIHAGNDRWECIMGQYRLPHIQTPYFLVSSQYDSYQLGRNGVDPKWLDEGSVAYAGEFAARMAALLRSLRSSWPANTSMENAVFSWSCWDHASSLWSNGFDRQSCTVEEGHQITLDVALNKWLMGDSKNDFEWIDNCDGFACGEGCSSKFPHRDPHATLKV